MTNQEAIELQDTDVIAMKRFKILDRHMQDLGRVAGVSVSVVSGGAEYRHYLVGDVVVFVRLIGSTTQRSRRSTIPTDVPWNYEAAVVGIDQDGELYEVGHARLRLYTIFNIRQAIKNHPELEFDMDLVIRAIAHRVTTD